jgi:hypothetical protein
MMEPVIDEEVWEQFCLEQCSQGKLKYALCNDNEAMKESEQCHLRMVYEAFNEALNYIRPYGIRGQPYPWLSNPLKAYQHVTTLSNYEKAMVQLDESRLGFRDCEDAEVGSVPLWVHPGED